MAIEIVVPRLGWSMDEGTFAEWLKREGDWVNAGDMIFVLEGEKAAQEIESFDSGVLRIPPDAPQPGDTVAVGQLLAYLVDKDEPAPFESAAAVAASSTAALSETSAGDKPPSAGPAVRRLARDLDVDLNGLQGTGPSGRVTPDDVRAAAEGPVTGGNGHSGRREGRVAISPRARRVARELGVDWTSLSGSGRNGRIRERDIQAAAAEQGDSGRSPQRSGKTIPITHVRRTIAERMLAGVHDAAPVTLTTKADATNLVNLREQLKSAGSREVCPTYTDLLIKLATEGLKQHPLLKSRWTEEGIVVPDSVNIAFAVHTDDGLLAPVVKDVGALTLREVASATRSLVEAARARQLTAEQMQGGTFTISNLGAFGIDAFTPIINLPQAAILGVGRIVREPVVLEDDRIVPRDMLTLSVTFDHRVVDGAPAAQFVDTLRQCIEQPAAWLLS